MTQPERTRVRPAKTKGPDGNEIRRRIVNPRTGKPIPTDRYTPVPPTSYWFRRVLVGDVEVEQAETKTKAKKATPKKRARK